MNFIQALEELVQDPRLETLSTRDLRDGAEFLLELGGIPSVEYFDAYYEIRDADNYSKYKEATDVSKRRRALGRLTAKMPGIIWDLERRDSRAERFLWELREAARVKALTLREHRKNWSKELDRERTAWLNETLAFLKTLDK